MEPNQTLIGAKREANCEIYGGMRYSNSTCCKWDGVVD